MGHTRRLLRQPILLLAEPVGAGHTARRHGETDGVAAALKVEAQPRHGTGSPKAMMAERLATEEVPEPE